MNQSSPSIAEHFEWEKDKAQAIAAPIGKAVSTWREEAARDGISKSEINRIATAFEHDDLKTNAGKVIHSGAGMPLWLCLAEFE